jgi:hypothetical protein
MDPRPILRTALQSATYYIDQIMAEVTPEQAHWVPPGTMQTIAATYAHAAIATDWQTSTLFFRRPALYETEWSGKSGVRPEVSPYITPEWGKTVQVDLPQLRDYARAAFNQALTVLDNEDLEHVVDMSIIGAGHQTLGWCLSNVVTSHLYILAGEIAALKGVQGLKGDLY